MCTAIISGLLNTKSIPASQITVSEPLDAVRTRLSALGVNTTTSNATATQDASIVVIAVKPQITSTVCKELGVAWTQRETLPTVLSIAAGVTLTSLTGWLTTSDGRVPHVVRAMPNTPALVGEGAAGLFAASEVAGGEREAVGALLGSVCSVVEWVESEGMLDVVTGLSGEFGAAGGIAT